MDIGKILIEKLTKEELNYLVEFWAEGGFEDVVIDQLLPEDIKNYPEQYFKGENKMTHKEKILGLKDGECYTWPESDYGKAEIWLKNDQYFLFEIPMYGGRPSYYGRFEIIQIDALIETVESWA